MSKVYSVCSEPSAKVLRSVPEASLRAMQSTGLRDNTADAPFLESRVEGLGLRV